MWKKYQPVWAPEGAAAGAGTTDPGNSGASGGATGGNATATALWHEGKIDPVTVGFWRNKGIDDKDPIVVSTKLSEMYRNAEGRLGAPPDELIRQPKPNASESDINAYWQRIGVPAESKDYDLSAVKRDGKDLDQGYADMLRATLHAGRVHKDQAAGIAAALVKFDEAKDAASLAEKTAHIKNEQEALTRNWGANRTYNAAIAERALQEIGKAAGLTPEQIKQGWDALSTTGGIGASYAMEMLRTIGAKMGEATFIPSQPGQSGENKIMSRDQAKAEIESLKKDRSFYEQIKKGSTEARRRWDDLHKIAFAA